ncbi:MAG: hypothetical protein AB1352_02650 [Patescibacteria group bacterium]
MLEQLFGSRTRIKLLKIFLAQPSQLFFVRELTRLIGERINSVRREIANLVRLGVLIQREPTGEGGERASLSSRAHATRKKKRRNVADSRKFYQANPEFVLYDELKSLIFKSQLLAGRSLSESIGRLGKVRLIILSGFFVGDTEAPTDILVVGTVHRRKLLSLIRQLQKSFGEEIRYTLMSSYEFKMRRAMTDKFLYRVLEGKRMVLVDRME